MSMHPETWDIVKFSQLAAQLTAGRVLAELAQRDPRIVVLTADLKHSNRTADFARACPDRFFNFGVAEKNMVCAAAGMAAAGKVPYLATYASFVGLLCCEQIRTALAYPKLPVRVLATHSGIAMGFYGTSHHATEDLAIMRSIANLTVLAPCDGRSLAELIRQTVDHPGPIYFRLGRGRETEVYRDDAAASRIQFGTPTLLSDGNDIAILATGTTVAASLEAAEKLKAAGIDAAVADMHSIKPLDVQFVLDIASRTGAVLTVEEHNIYGGLGGAVAEVLAEGGVRCRFRRHGLNDEYSLIGPPTRLYQHYRLDGDGIAAVATELLDRGAKNDAQHSRIQNRG